MGKVFDLNGKDLTKTDTTLRVPEEPADAAEVGKRNDAQTESLKAEKSRAEGAEKKLQQQVDTLNAGGLNLKEDLIRTQVDRYLTQHPEAMGTAVAEETERAKGVENQLKEDLDDYSGIVVDFKDGLVPIYLSKGTTITFETVDGSNFDGAFVLFYDANKQDISNTGWYLDSAQSKRTVTVRFATSDTIAYYTSTTSNKKIRISGCRNREYINQRYLDATCVIETFNKGKWVQGTIYNGQVDYTNKKCISYPDYFECSELFKIEFETDTRWNIRCSYYDERFNFISYEGYTERKCFFVPSNAIYFRVSISLLVGDDNPDITPSDYTDSRSIKIMLFCKKLYKYAREIKASLVNIAQNEDIPHDAKSAYYNGEKIAIKQNIIAYKKYMRLDASIFGGQSIQGCSQYNNLLFVACNTMSTIAIFDLSTKELVSIINFPPVSTYHCNSMNFGTEKYAGDELPLLYISMENIAEHKMIALRVTKSSDNIYSGEIKQTITYPVPSESAQYFPNGSLDNVNGFLFVKGYTQNSYIAENGNSIRVRKWVMPKLSDGDVTLRIEDALQTFDIPALSCTQGELVVNGRMIGCYGADWAGDKSIRIAMIDPTQEKMITNIKMNTAGYAQEPESLFIWKDELYILDVNGEINKLYFN